MTLKGRNTRAPDMADGAQFESRNYGTFEITQYYNANRIRVRFLATGGVTHASSQTIRLGTVKDPKLPTAKPKKPTASKIPPQTKPTQIAVLGIVREPPKAKDRRPQPPQASLIYLQVGNEFLHMSGEGWTTNIKYAWCGTREQASRLMSVPGHARVVPYLSLHAHSNLENVR